MQLDWTGALKNTNAARQTISAEFLEPFSSSESSCSNYSTCLACSTDLSCGWCDSDTSSSCIGRSSVSVDRCIASTGSLVLVSMHCPICADHVDCTSCVQVSCLISYSCNHFHALEIRIVGEYFKRFIHYYLYSFIIVILLYKVTSVTVR